MRDAVQIRTTLDRVDQIVAVARGKEPETGKVEVDKTLGLTPPPSPFTLGFESPKDPKIRSTVKTWVGLDPGSDYRDAALDDEKVATRWQHYFLATRVGKVVVTRAVYPHKQRKGEVIVRLPPDMGGFGSGFHPSTRLVLELMQKQGVVKRGSRVVDLGSGTGILAVAAAKMGCLVDAVEPALESIRECEHVVDVNGVTGGVRLFMETVESHSPDRKYGLVIANIIASVHIESAETYRSMAKKGNQPAVAILGGIKDDEPDVVRYYMEAAGWRLNEQVQMEAQTTWTAQMYRLS